MPRLCLVLQQLATLAFALDFFSQSGHPANGISALNSDMRRTYNMMVDATGLNFTEAGIDCSPPTNWSTPAVSCVLALTSEKPCFVSTGQCAPQVKVDYRTGVVSIAAWDMREWLPLVRDDECPGLSFAGYPDVDRDCPCTELRLKRVYGKSVSHLGPDAAGIYRRGVCYVGGMRAIVQNGGFIIDRIDSMLCTFDGRRFWPQANMPDSVVQGCATSHAGAVWAVPGQLSPIFGDTPTIWKGSVAPCVDGGPPQEGCGDGQPWSVYKWEVLPTTTTTGPGPGLRIACFLTSSYGVGRGLGHPDLQGLRGAPWEVSQAVQPQLVLTGGTGVKDVETWYRDMWILHPPVTPGANYTWERFTISMPPPPSPILVAVDDDDSDDDAVLVNSEESGSYYLLDVRGNLTVPGMSLLPADIPQSQLADLWPHASGALLLLAGSEPWLSVDGGLTWTRVFNTVAGSADVSALSPLWSGYTFTGAALVTGLDDAGALLLRAPPHRENAGYDPSVVVSGYAVSCLACDAGYYSSGCTNTSYDRVCLPCSTCSGDGVWQKRACQGVSDTQCAPCTVCGAGFQLVASCTLYNDTVCSAEPAGAADAAMWIASSSAFSLLGTVVSLLLLLLPLLTPAARTRLMLYSLRLTWRLRVVLCYLSFLLQLSLVAAAASVLQCASCGPSWPAGQAILALFSLSLCCQAAAGIIQLRRFVRLSSLQSRRSTLLDVQLQHVSLSVLLHGASLLHSSALGSWLDPVLLLRRGSGSGSKGHDAQRKDAARYAASGPALRSAARAALVSAVLVDLPHLAASASGITMAQSLPLQRSAAVLHITAVLAAVASLASLVHALYAAADAYWIWAASFSSHTGGSSVGGAAAQQAAEDSMMETVPGPVIGRLQRAVPSAPHQAAGTRLRVQVAGSARANPTPTPTAASASSSGSVLTDGGEQLESMVAGLNPLGVAVAAAAAAAVPVAAAAAVPRPELAGWAPPPDDTASGSVLLLVQDDTHSQELPTASTLTYTRPGSEPSSEE